MEKRTTLPGITFSSEIVTSELCESYKNNTVPINSKIGTKWALDFGSLDTCSTSLANASTLIKEIGF